ncbi:MAG: NAD(+) synthase [Acidobacteria bacterium]|nr:MAG: NAD(+) synthase [Acidobacteriota bacterium]
MQLKISLAQINPKTGDIRGNAARIVRGIDEARRENADLVIFPEMCLTGYCLDEKLLINLQFLRANQEAILRDIAPACEGITAVVGFIDLDEERRGPDNRVVRRNAAAVIRDGRVLQIVKKRLLPAYRYFEDKRYFEAGREVEPVTIETSRGSVRIGVLICEDFWDEGYELKPTAIYAAKGAELLVCINASPFVGCNPGRRDGKRSARMERLQSQVARYRIPIIYVNTVGIGDNGKNIIPYDGSSLALDRDGKLVASLRPFAEDQHLLALEDGVGCPVPEPAFDREGEIYDALVMSVRDYYDKLGIFRGVLEAVSGGIDSALGTAIAFDAMGRDLLTLYNLPSRYNSSKTQELARALADNFQVEYHVIPIQSMVDQVVQDFEKHLHPIRIPVTLENLQSRIRGLIMMAESNDRQALLLTNGNETEIALGYATLYGDMVGGLSVIGDLPKPDVYRLARYVNRKYGRTMIPEEIFTIPASAELKDNQVDPFDYDVVGPMMNDFTESGWSPDEMVERFKARALSPEKYGEGERSVYDRHSVDEFAALAHRLYRSLSQSVYKRLQGAPIIAVSDRAFGFDLRETIINGWDGG